MTACDLGPTVVGRAFHALEPDEEDHVEEHLAGCVACRQALDDAREIAATLGAAVPQVDPPVALRERVLAAARAEPHPPRTAPPVEILPEAPAPEPASPSTVSTPQRVSRRSRTALVAVAAAAVLGVGLLGVRAVVPTESGPTTGDPTSLAERAQRVVDGAATREPGTRHATLRTGEGQPVAVVLAEPAGARVVPLSMTGAGSGHRYVLWATGRDAPIAVATVDPTEGTTVPLPGAVAPPSPRAYAVSVEPDGPVPTRPSAVTAIGVLV